MARVRSRCGAFGLTRWVLAGAAVLACPLLIGPPEARAVAAGALDRSFGIDGVGLAPVAGDGGANSVAVQPDGKIIVAGQSAWTGSGTFVAARFHSNGSLDRSFGGDGAVSFPFGQSAAAAHALVTPDGLIVLTGAAFRGGRLQMAVARLRPGGSLDQSFGDGGVVTESVGHAAMAMTAMRLQSGKLVVAGTAKVRDSGGGSVNLRDFNFAAIRLHADGTLDTWYGEEGRLVGPGPAHAYAAALQPDGKLVWAGETVNDGRTGFAAARATAAGRIDRSYGYRGMASIPIGIGSRAVGLVVAGNGSATLAGNAYTNKFVTALARLTVDGRRDPAFGDSGVVTIASARHANGLIRQPDGRLVIPETGGLSAVRLHPDGAMDQAFGIGGLFQHQLGDRSAANAAAMAPDGAILLSGAVVEDGVGHLAVARVFSGLEGP
jgi:uncharacterized delta-60 repeat protein